MTTAVAGMVDVSALPRIAIDVATLESASGVLRSAAGEIGRAAVEISFRWTGALPSRLAVPGAVERLYGAMAPSAAAGVDLSTDTGGASAALNDFCAAVTTLRSRQRRLEEDIAAFTAHAAAVVGRRNDDLDVGDEPLTWRGIGDLVDANAELEDRVQRLRRDWTAPQADCADALRRLRNTDTDDGLFVGQHSVPETRYGFDFVGAATAFDKRITDRQLELLERLGAMTVPELERWRKRHATAYEAFIDQPPDPTAVDAWWRGLGNDPRTLSAVQHALATALPVLIGNLQGVFFSARDLANRTAVQAYRSSGRNTAMDKTIAKIRQQMALADATGTPLQITTLDPRGVPRAALTIGDLDIADDVTYLVPGMLTWTAGNDAVPQWVDSARGLRRTQESYDPGSTHAVVAWIGYDAPSLLTEPSVRQARLGGTYLAGELDGVRATRHGDPTINVVGHSYGTTVSSVALQQTHADRFVTLASAGLAVERRSDLQVPAGEMYSTEARGDRWADLGRGPSQHRTKPTAAFGTKLFDVGPDGVLLGSHTHDSNPGVLLSDGHWMSDGDGYLSPGSHSLDSVAKITVGQGNHVTRSDYDG